jgi:hypothetical protein
MGTINEDEVSPTQLLWLYKLGSAQSCCAHCFNLNLTPTGQCNVWGYFPGGDSCAIVYGYDGPGKDAACPAGSPAIGLLKATGAQSTFPYGIGAPGSCYGSIYTFTTLGQ